MEFFKTSDYTYNWIQLFLISQACAIIKGFLYYFFRYLATLKLVSNLTWYDNAVLKTFCQIPQKIKIEVLWMLVAFLLKMTV